MGLPYDGVMVFVRVFPGTADLQRRFAGPLQIVVRIHNAQRHERAAAELDRFGERDPQPGGADGGHALDLAGALHRRDGHVTAVRHAGSIQIVGLQQIAGAAHDVGDVSVAIDGDAGVAALLNDKLALYALQGGKVDAVGTTDEVHNIADQFVVSLVDGPDDAGVRVVLIGPVAAPLQRGAAFCFRLARPLQLVVVVHIAKGEPGARLDVDCLAEGKADSRLAEHLRGIGDVDRFAHFRVQAVVFADACVRPLPALQDLGAVGRGDAVDLPVPLTGTLLDAEHNLLVQAVPTIRYDRAGFVEHIIDRCGAIGLGPDDHVFVDVGKLVCNRAVELERCACVCRTRPHKVVVVVDQADGVERSPGRGVVDRFGEHEQHLRVVQDHRVRQRERIGRPGHCRRNQHGRKDTDDKDA